MTENERVLHLLNRITYGPLPGAIQQVQQMGIDATIEQQLHPERQDENLALTNQLVALPSLTMSTTQLLQRYMPWVLERPPGKPGEDEKKIEREQSKQVVEELMAAKILRATESPAQLQELMVDFWYNHFNVSAAKGLDRLMVTSYERDAIRPHALGKFRDLLEATAHHPAMMFYLDNWLNTDPNSKRARGQQNGINENYAREIMELHTLGVDAGYTQTDVTTLAHVLTGAGLGRGPQRGNFVFEAERHDSSDKLFLGEHIHGDGESEMEQALGILARKPATARHISFELAQFFVADAPPQSLVDAMTNTFTHSDGDIREVLRTMLHAPEFWDSSTYRAKFKPPLRFVISSLRATAIVPEELKPVMQAIAGMSEPLYLCQTPDGYPSTSAHWLNSDALLKRIGIARKLVNKADIKAVGPLMETLGDDFTTGTRDSLREAGAKAAPAMVLSSPEFLYY